VPGGVVEVIALVVSGWAGDRLNNRILFSMVGLSVALLGVILIVALPLHSGGRLAGYYMTQASPTPFVALLSLISSNIAGYTKKTTIAAMYLIAYCVGNIIGLLPVQESEGASADEVSRAANLPAKGRPSIPASRNHHHLLLGCMSD
jgi:hypothetical protein